MNSSLFDPNNHVPEVSPDDSWGDQEQIRPPDLAGPTVLPPKRTLADPSSSVVQAEVGLRIESNLARTGLEDSQPRLEVQEIDGSVVRLSPEIEAPPKVERQFTFHEKPVEIRPGKKPKKLGVNVKRLHRGKPSWILGMGLTVTALVISSLMLLPAINAPNAPREDSQRRILSVVNEEEVEGMESLNNLLEKQPEALQIFRSYAQASGIDEVIPLVKDGRMLEETLRKHWKPLGLPNSWTPATDSSWSIMDLGGQPSALMEGNLPGSSKFTAYFTQQSGRLVLDWKATVAFGTASFSQLEAGSGDGSEIRGEIEPANFFTAHWPEAEYGSYLLESPDKNLSIWCFARRDGAAGQSIARLFNKGDIVVESQNSRKVTLRLVRGPDGTPPNQWLVGEMLHIDWATP
jgi:hypothetical protein